MVVATPLDATGVPLSEVPANARTVNRPRIEQQNPLDLANLLDHNIGSVSVSDGTGNPYQNDINYRGFQATSLGLSGTNSIYSLALEQFRTPAPPRAIWLKIAYAFRAAGISPRQDQQGARQPDG